MLKWLKKIFVTRQDLNRSNRDSWRNFSSLLGSTATELGLISTAALLKIKTVYAVSLFPVLGLFHLLVVPWNAYLLGCLKPTFPGFPVTL